MFVAKSARNPWPAKLKALKERTGKSHQELADIIGVSRRTWRAWLYNESQPGKLAAQLLTIRFGKHLD
jgi:DNA-binding transcriptional regulator YiaG